MSMTPDHKTITCEHRTDTVFRHEQVVTFPTRLYLRLLRTLKKKRQVLTEGILERLTQAWGMFLRPEGFKEIHKCEKLTVYQKEKSTQRHFVLKV